jgi:YaaC-like Protein
MPVGAPPKALDGVPATLKGVPIAAGVHHRSRTLTVRATLEELWAPLDIAATPQGRKALWETSGVAGASADSRTFDRFSAYLAQARSFYFAAQGMDIRSRPLTGYYALLNLSKAWLTLIDPTTTSVAKVLHGAADAFTLSAGQYYTWSKEQLALHPSGVLPEIARRTGRGYVVVQKTTMSLGALLPYLCEAFDELEDSEATPRLLPLADVVVHKGEADDNGTLKTALWLRAEVDRGALNARNISPSALPTRAGHFGAVFAHRQSTETTFSYESSPVFSGPNVTHALPGIRAAFDESMIFVNRGAGPHRYFAVLADTDLLSHEALTFAVLHHLSNMVRYRPEQVDRLAAGPRTWLLSTWVPRALENALLTYSGRILEREVRLV